MVGCGRSTEQSAPATDVLTNIGKQMCDTSSIKLDRLMDANMSGEIDCLSNSISTFFDSVQTKTKNNVSKVELVTFLKNYSKEESNIEKSLDLLYLFNHLFRGDPEDTIHRTNFLSVLSVLKGFNQEIIHIYPYLDEVVGERRALRYRDDKPTDKKLSWDLFRLRRARVQLAANKMSQIFSEYIVMQRPTVDQINLEDLLNKMLRQDTIVPDIKKVVDYPESTIYAMMETILSEKDDVLSAKKLVSTFAVSNEIAKVLVPMIKDHVPNGNEQMVNNIRSLLFMKRVFLGGKPEILTHTEFNRLIKILPGFITVAFDLINLPYIEFGSLMNRFKVLSEDIEFLAQEIAFSAKSQEKVVGLEEIFKATTSLRIKFSEYPIAAMKGTVTNVKTMVFKGSADYFTGQELHSLMDKVRYAVKMVGFASQMYDDHKEILSQDQVLSKNQIKTLEQYKTKPEDLFYKTRFVRAVSTYRLFKGKEKLPLFDNAIKRSPEGVSEVMLYEYALGFILNYYNPGKQTPESYHLLSIDDQSRILDIIEKIKDYLVLVDLYPRKPAKTADNLRLVTDLFQTTSDGKNGVGIAEAVDLVGILRDAGVTGKGVLKTMVDSQVCEADAKGGITVQCYRDNFYQAFSQYSKYFPKFQKFVDEAKANGKDDVLTELLKRTEFFSRDCALESRPIYPRDMSGIMGGLLDIESTIIHFDKNQNNLLDYEELNDAFPIYKDAIIVVAKLKPKQDFLARSIFLYLVKHQKIPTTGKLLAFFAGLEVGWEKNITGDRVTIATLLKYISSMNAKEDHECK